MCPFRYGKLSSDRISLDGHTGATFLGVDGGFQVRKVNEGETSRSGKNLPIFRMILFWVSRWRKIRRGVAFVR